MLRLIGGKGLVGVLVIFLLAIPLLAQEKEIARAPRVKEALNLLDIWIKSELDYKRIPGFSIAVVHDQELFWSKGFGYANLEDKIPAEPDTIYSICSISKLFTSVAIMQLRDAGKLDLDEPLSKYLPWFAIKKTDPDAPPITIRSVLRHSSGLPRESEQPYKTEPDLPWPERESMIEKLPTQETLYPTDTYFQYSNLGISLLGEVVAAVSGQSYNDYITEHILKPIGMNDTTPYLPEDKLGTRLAVGYSRWPREGGRERLPFFQAKGFTPAAGLASTAIDLAKFASWQFRALDNKDNSVLSGYTLKEMHRVHWVDPDWETKWGLGFATWRPKDVVFVGHGGGCPGYRTHIALSPKDKIAAVCMTNATDANIGTFTEKAYEILAPAIDETLKAEKEPEPYPADLEKYTGFYRTHWGETAVFIWKGSLAIIFLPTDNPMEAITELKKTGEHVFRRVRKDKELGEEYIFELDDAGNVKWYKSFSYYMKKVS
jgi:CubicO group peptidase (beta-lactamase class C family)